MSNSNIKPGEMEDIVPEEVSAVETPAVPEAGFVVLNKSETPEPESTEDTQQGGVSEETFPLAPDASTVESGDSSVTKAQETLEILEPEGSVSEASDVIAKALVDLKLNLDGLSDIQKGQLLDLAIAVAPEEEDDMAEEACDECVAGEDGMCKACGKKVEKACLKEEAKKIFAEDMEKGGNTGVQLNEQIFKMNALLEQLIQKQATPVLSDEEILAKAEEVKLRKAAEAKADAVDDGRDAQIEALVGRVAQLAKALGRACGQDL